MTREINFGFSQIGFDYAFKIQIGEKLQRFHRIDIPRISDIIRMWNIDLTTLGTRY